MTGRGIVIVGAFDHVASTIQKTLLILTQAVVVFIVRGRKVCPYSKERWVSRPAIIYQIMVAVLIIWSAHLPAIEVQKLLTIWSDDIQTDKSCRAGKELAYFRFRPVIVGRLRR